MKNAPRPKTAAGRFIKRPSGRLSVKTRYHLLRVPSHASLGVGFYSAFAFPALARGRLSASCRKARINRLFSVPAGGAYSFPSLQFVVLIVARGKRPVKYFLTISVPGRYPGRPQRPCKASGTVPDGRRPCGVSGTVPNGRPQRPCKVSGTIPNGRGPCKASGTVPAGAAYGVRRGQPRFSPAFPSRSVIFRICPAPRPYFSAISLA